MVEFTAIKPTRISDSVVEQIEEMILTGALRPGEKLPPERELAEQLGISRPTLREAIVILESKGLLESRRRGGTIVLDISEAGISDPLFELVSSRPSLVFHVLELREALEISSAYHAASRATPEEREAIAAKHRELEAVYEDSEADIETEARIDTEFHLSIAEASHNLALIHVMRGLMEVLQSGVAFNLDKLREEPERHDRIKAQHAEICEAVISGDPERARNAAGQHLSFVQDSLVDYTESRRTGQHGR